MEKRNPLRSLANLKFLPRNEELIKQVVMVSYIFSSTELSNIFFLVIYYIDYWLSFI